MPNIKSIFSTRNILNMLGAGVLLGIIFFCVWMRDLFSYINLDEIAVAISAGFAGTDCGIIWSFIAEIIVPAFWGAALVAYILHLVKKYKFAKYIIWVALLAGVMFAGRWANFECGRLCNFSVSDFYETEYVNPDDAEIKFDNRRNVLIIVTESIETAYADTTLFGENLIPNISRLSDKHVSFDKYITIDGWARTIAAITGITTGLPLFFISKKNTKRMAGATGIGNIFKDNGYRTMAIFPATGKFTQKTEFLTRMGFDVVYDGERLKSRLKRRLGEEPFGGVDDGTMFEISKPIISKFIHMRAPYVLFMETINTHARGYFTDECRNLGFAQETYQDIIKCDDYLIADFIRWFRRQDPSAVVILVNDHQQHKNSTIPELESRNTRFNANVFMNTNAFNYDYQARTITTADFFPTIIDVAGGKIHGCRLGMGTSLSARCSKTPTLAEKYGIHKFQELLSGQSVLYNKLSLGE